MFVLHFYFTDIADILGNLRVRTSDLWLKGFHRKISDILLCLEPSKNDHTREGSQGCKWPCPRVNESFYFPKIKNALSFPELPFYFPERPFCFPELSLYFSKIPYFFPELLFSFPEVHSFYLLYASLFKNAFFHLSSSDLLQANKRRLISFSHNK